MSNMTEVVLQVGVKALIKNAEGRYLVLERSVEKYPEVPNRWDIPGGRIDPGSTLLDNLTREIREETGLTLTGNPSLVAAQDILRIAGKHIVRLTYIVTVEAGEPQLDGDEHDRFDYFSLEELRNKKGVDIYVQEVAQKFL